MRLLTYNALRSRVKGSSGDLPLEIKIDNVEIQSSETDFEFIRHVVPSLDWNAVVLASKAISLDGMPEIYDEKLLEDDQFIELLHHLLIDVHVISGQLRCTETGKIFPIENSIPNFTLVETDVK